MTATIQHQTVDLHAYLAESPDALYFEAAACRTCQDASLCGCPLSDLVEAMKGADEDGAYTPPDELKTVRAFVARHTVEDEHSPPHLLIHMQIPCARTSAPVVIGSAREALKQHPGSLVLTCPQCGALNALPLNKDPVIGWFFESRKGHVIHCASCSVQVSLGAGALH